jgi:hypothetical protein
MTHVPKEVKQAITKEVCLAIVNDAIEDLEVVKKQRPDLISLVTVEQNLLRAAAKHAETMSDARALRDLGERIEIAARILSIPKKLNVETEIQALRKLREELKEKGMNCDAIEDVIRRRPSFHDGNYFGVQLALEGFAATLLAL